MQDGRLSIERVQMEGRNKTHSLVTGNITWGMLWFAVPMILGNLLQQFYNIADTLIIGRFLGAKALAAVGSAYTLMIFLTSVLLGLCMGSGVVFSLQYGARDHEALKRSIFVSLVLIGVITLLLNIAVFVWIFCGYCRSRLKYISLCGIICGLFFGESDLPFSITIMLPYSGLSGILSCPWSFWL